MPILELFPKPARGNDQSGEQPGNQSPTEVAPPPKAAAGPQPILTGHSRRLHPLRRDHRIRISTGRFGELDEHELIHLIDALDDERARARFRESVYISVIVWLAIGWFLFYGPRVLFHVPQYRDPIAVMKEHDQQLTLNLPKAPPVPKVAPKIDTKTMDALKRQAEMERLARQAPPTPQPPVEQAPPPPQEEAHNTAPPVPQPPLPLPAAPRPAPPSVELPSAPKPNFAQNSQSAHDAMQNAMRGALPGRGGEISAPSSAGPLQAGAQILSDTQGVDFSAYMRRLRADLYRNWEPLIPEEVQPPLLKRGITGIIFWILPDGEISGPNKGQPVLETPSGDIALDRAAWGAITSEGQFPPLPREYHGPMLALRIGFFYNEPLQQ